MSRGGHNWKGGGTVEGTRSLNVMHLKRAGYLVNFRRAGWQWTYRDGTRANIDIEDGRDSIKLNYRFKSYEQDWESVEQRVPVLWTPAALVARGPGSSAMCMPTGSTAEGALPSSTVVAVCLPAGIAIAWDTLSSAAGQWIRRTTPLPACIGKLSADYDGPDMPPPPKPKWMRWNTYNRITTPNRGRPGEARYGVHDWRPKHPGPGSTRR